MGEIGVKSYMKGDYEVFNALKAAKNKANSKPISSVMRAFSPMVQEIATALRASQ